MTVLLVSILFTTSNTVAGSSEYAFKNSIRTMEGLEAMKKALEIVSNFLVPSISITYLGQDPGGFMNDRAKVADLLIGEVSNVWIFQGLEGETLGCLSEGEIDVLVRNAAASVEREGAVWRKLGVRPRLAGRLSQSLGRKVHEVAELQLAGVGEAAGEAGKLAGVVHGAGEGGGEGGELGVTEGEEKGGQEISRHADSAYHCLHCLLCLQCQNVKLTFRFSSWLLVTHPGTNSALVFLLGNTQPQSQ